MYAFLLRLSQQGWISADWGASENNRKAKFYSITKSGRKQLTEEERAGSVFQALSAAFCNYPHGGDAMSVSHFRKLGSRPLRLFRRGALGTEFDNEVEVHILLLAARFKRQGMTADEARYAARRQFGRIRQMKEELGERRGFQLFEIFVQDARYILRLLRKSPVFTASAVLTLAFGIGASTPSFHL